MTRIAFYGLGTMGLPMARNLAAAGPEVVADHLVAGGDAVPRHRQAHRPETVDGDSRQTAGSLPKNVFEIA